MTARPMALPQPFRARERLDPSMREPGQRSRSNIRYVEPLAPPKIQPLAVAVPPSSGGPYQPDRKLISTICGPLDDDGRLHAEGLRLHLEDQSEAGIGEAGIDSVLLGGTMGLLQLLADETWKALVQQGTAASRGRGDVLVGVGDCSFDRTRARIEAVDTLPIEGVGVLAPYFLAFSQDELACYYEALADVSPPADLSVRSAGADPREA